MVELITSMKMGILSLSSDDSGGVATSAISATTVHTFNEKKIREYLRIANVLYRRYYYLTPTEETTAKLANIKSVLTFLSLLDATFAAKRARLSDIAADGGTSTEVLRLMLAVLESGVKAAIFTPSSSRESLEAFIWLSEMPCPPPPEDVFGCSNVCRCLRVDQRKLVEELTKIDMLRDEYAAALPSVPLLTTTHQTHKRKKTTIRENNS